MVKPRIKLKSNRHADGELVTVKTERVSADEYRRRKPYKKG